MAAGIVPFPARPGGVELASAYAGARPFRRWRWRPPVWPPGAFSGRGVNQRQLWGHHDRPKGLGRARHARGAGCADIGTVYRLLRKAGISQRQIAALTDQTQSEVTEIVNGRHVMAYDVLVRIADGLGVPRGWVGLAHDQTTRDFLSDRDDGPRPTAEEEASEDVKRRVFLAAGAAAVVDRPALGVVPTVQDHAHVATPLPSRIGRSEVAALHKLTEELRALGRAGHPSMPEVLRPVVARADAYLKVPVATEAVQRALLSQVAELHTLTGWCYTDQLLIDSARYHFSRALQLADGAGDVVGVASAATHAAHINIDHQDAPDDALKLYQLADLKLSELPAGHPGCATNQVHLHACLAHCWAVMGRSDRANELLEQVADRPPIKDPFDRADLDYTRAKIRLAQRDCLLREGDRRTAGRAVEGAAALAATSVDDWPHSDLRDSALARITLATTHVIMGDSRAHNLTVAVLDAVDPDQDGLRSPRNRAMLAPLEQALSARTDSTSADLAQRARELRVPAG